MTGHIADKYSLRRAAVALFVLLSPAFLVASAMERDMHVRLLLVSLGYSCYNLHFTFFFSLLPSICDDIESEKGRRSKAHELSILSTAISNLGAALLLSGVVLFVQYAQGQHSTPIDTERGHVNTLVLFGLCASWWWVIAAPLGFHATEPTHSPPVTVVLKVQEEEEELSLWDQMKERKDMWLYLLGNYFVNEGSSVIYQMIALFAVSSLHLSQETVLISTIMNRLVATPMTISWYVLHQKYGVKPIKLYLIAVLVTGFVGFMCIWLTSKWQYYAVQFLLAWGGSGTFAFGRSIVSDMSTPGQAGLIFGLYAIVSRTAGALGPFLFGLAVQHTGNMTDGFLIVVAFFVVGSFFLFFVDTDRARSVAVSVHRRSTAGSQNDDFAMRRAVRDVNKEERTSLLSKKKGGYSR
ncbi:MFS transporter [bacterium]|nr:MFS transporter [bacterium]